MLIDTNTFASMIAPCRVGNAFSEYESKDLLRDSISRRYTAYTNLREIKNGVMEIGDIKETDTESYFDVLPSKHYPTIVESLSRDLIWSTTTNTIDYAATVDRWSQALENDRIKVAWLDRINENDLTDPGFGDFKIILAEYLLSCDRKGDTYYRAQGFRAD